MVHRALRTFRSDRLGRAEKVRTPALHHARTWSEVAACLNGMRIAIGRVRYRVVARYADGFVHGEAAQGLVRPAHGDVLQPATCKVRPHLT